MELENRRSVFTAGKFKPMLNFKEKIILITGASSGLGEALACNLVTEKAIVLLVARRSRKLAKICQKINKNKTKAFYFIADVTSQKQVKEVYEKIIKKFGRIDIAFLNAGIGDNSLVQNLDAGRVEKIIRVNFMGVIYWLDVLLKEMQIANKGLIVITSSLAAFKGLPGAAAYNASKAALNAFIESAQIDLLATGIKVVNLMPYFLITEMTGADTQRNPRIWTSSDKAAKLIIAKLKKGRQEIIFPRFFHLFMYFFKIIPGSWYRLFWKILRRGG